MIDKDLIFVGRDTPRNETYYFKMHADQMLIDNIRKHMIETWEMSEDKYDIEINIEVKAIKK